MQFFFQQHFDFGKMYQQVQLPVIYAGQSEVLRIKVLRYVVNNVDVVRVFKRHFAGTSILLSKRSLKAYYARTYN